MSDFIAKVKAILDTSEVEKKLSDLEKRESKVKMTVDSSELDKATKQTDKLKDKKVNVDAKVTGKDKIDGVSKSLDTATKKANTFGSMLGKMGVSFSVFNVLRRGADAAVDDIKDVHDAIVDLQMATNDNYASVRNLVSGYNALAKELGATTTEVTKGADAYLRQGKSIEETNKLIRDSMIFSKVAQVDSEAATDYLTAIRNGFHKTVDEMSSVNDAIMSIDLNAAVNSAGLAEATSRVSANAQTAGVELNKLLGYSAAIGEASQESMSVIGNSLKTIFQRLSGIKAGNLELIDEDGTIETLSDVEAVLNNIGVPLRDTANEFRNFGDVLDETANKWESLSSVQKAAVSSALAGTRQSNRFQLLMQNYDKALKYEQIANSSSGVAEEKFQNYLNSLEAKQKSLQASFESLSFNLISRDTITDILEATQAVVEFADSTRLAQGALAGMGTGVMLKGFVSLVAHITQATMKMQNFQQALDMTKAGNIGTTEIQKLASLVDGLSQSQLKAVLSSQQLSNAQRISILTSTGMSEAEAKATISTLGLSAAERTAATSTISLGTTLKGLWSTLLANPIMLVTLAVTAGVTAWSNYKQSVEESIQTASEATNAWSESNNTLQEQINKYKELKSQLNSGILSPSEEYEVKQQILDIQTQITEQYGSQVSGVDLVNGSLQTQLGLLQQITAEHAKTSLNENREVYEDVEKAMTRNRTYYIGDTEMSVDSDGVGKDIYNIAKSFEDQGITLSDNGMGSVTIHFKGDASEADKTINDFMNEVSELEDKYSKDSFSTDIINNVLDSSSRSLKENQEVLDNYQENYKTFLQMEMLSKGTGDGTVADTFNEYTEAIERYNSALSSGDTDEINSARILFQDVNTEVSEILSQGDNSKFTQLFDEVGEQLNEASIKANDFKEVLNDTMEEKQGNQFEPMSNGIKQASTELKNLKLDAVDVMDALVTGGEQSGESQIWQFAKAWGITIDSTEEEMQSFIDVLVETGIVSGDLESNLDSLSYAVDKYSTNIQKAIQNIETVKSVMSESVSGAGISADNVKAFKEIYGDEAEKALEKTANGYHINKKALAELQRQQEVSTKSEYLDTLAEQQEMLRSLDERMAKGLSLNQDISGLELQREGIEANIASLKDLQLQYDSANSAYQQWQDALSGGEEGDMYRAMSDEVEKVKDLYDKELYGNNEFIKAVDLYSSKSVTTAAEAKAEWEKIGGLITGIFSGMDDRSGIDTFAKKAQEASKKLGESWVTWNKEMNDWDFSDKIDDKALAEAMGLDVEAFQAAMRALAEYGYDVDLEQPVMSLSDLKKNAESAKQALDAMKDSGLSEVSLDTDNFNDVTANIDKVKNYIEVLNEDENIDVDVRTEKLEEANTILEYLVAKQNDLISSPIEFEVSNAETLQSLQDANERLKELAKTKIDFNFDTTDMDVLTEDIESATKMLEEFKNKEGKVDLSLEGASDAVNILSALISRKQELENPAVMNVDTSSVDGELGDAIYKLQEFQSAVNALETAKQLKVAGVDVDTSTAEEKVNSLLTEIQQLNPDITAKLNVDSSTAASLTSSIQALTPEVMVKAGVDRTAVDSYVPGDKDATVKYKVDSSVVDIWIAPTKTATVNYSLGTVAKPPTATVKVNYSSGRDYQYGTAYAHGNWGAKKSEKALVGERGQELVVSGSTFRTVGDNGAELTDIKQGDIIFDHNQTKAILSGRTGGRGKVIGGSAYANGTAYSSGTPTIKRTSSVKYNSTKTSNKSKSSSSNSNAEESIEKIDWIKRAVEAVQRAIENLGKVAEATYKKWTTRNSALAEQIVKVNEEIDLQQKAYERYRTEAESVELSSYYKQLIQAGKIDIETIKNESLKEKLEEYQEYYDLAIEAKDAIIDLKDELTELAQMKFDNSVQKYKDELSEIEHRIEMVERVIEQTETEGHLVSGAYYKELIEVENENIVKLQEQYKELTAKLTDAMATGSIEKNSEMWHEMKSEINGVELALQEANTQLIEYQNNLRELEWDVFDRMQEMLGRVHDESDALLDLMDDDKRFDEKGIITSEGMATVGLHAVKYNTYASQIADYRKELEKLNEELLADPSDTTVQDRIVELEDAIWDLSAALKDEEKAIIEIATEGVETYLDAMDSLISKHKAALSSVKSLHDYEKSVSKLTNEIASLEKQKSAYMGDISEAGRATLQKIEAKLEEAREELEETEYDRYIDDIEVMLDNVQSDTSEWLNSRLDDISLIMQSAIDATNQSASDIQETLQNEADEVGITLSDEMQAIWGKDGTFSQVVAEYGINMATQLTTTNSVLERIRQMIAGMLGVSDKEATDNIDKTESASNSHTTAAPNESTSNATSKTLQTSSSGDGIPKVGDKVTFASGNYFLDSAGTAPTGSKYRGKQVYITSVNDASWAKKKYHISTGNKLGNGDLGWVSLEQLKGYKHGGLLDETGLFIGHGTESNPEIVLNPKDSENFLELRDTLRAFSDNDLSILEDTFKAPGSIFNSMKGMNSYAEIENIPRQTSNNFEIHFENIELPNVTNTDEFITELFHSQRFTKGMSNIIAGSLIGSNSLERIKY